MLPSIPPLREDIRVTLRSGNVATVQAVRIDTGRDEDTPFIVVTPLFR